MSPDVVDAYLDRDIPGQRDWYAQESLKAQRKLALSTWTGIVFGLFATVLAALPTGLSGLSERDQGLLKWLLVIVTAVATLANGTLAPRYRRLAQTRETGLLETLAVEKRARAKLTYRPMTSEERAKAFGCIAEQLIAVETARGSPDGGFEHR